MFWEIAGIIANVAQLVAQLSAINNYKSKLEFFADQLCTWADNNRDKYLDLRACDPDFYNYYKSLPGYTSCDSSVARSKGAAYHGYGSRLRRAIKTNRGYTPLAKVHLNHMLSEDAIAQTALTRVVTEIKERKREDNHVLQQWSAIVGAPVGVERYYSGSSAAIIQQSFTNLKALSQGFNSAGAAFGTSLYRILD